MRKMNVRFVFDLHQDGGLSGEPKGRSLFQAGPREVWRRFGRNNVQPHARLLKKCRILGLLPYLGQRVLTCYYMNAPSNVHDLSPASFAL